MTRSVGVRRWGTALVGYLVAGVMFFPILWMILTGFKFEAEAFQLPPSLTFKPTLASYAQVFERSNYLLHLWNSFAAAFGSTALGLVLGIPAAYHLAFFPTRRTLFVLLWMVSTKFIPPVGVIAAIYVIYNQVGLLNQLSGLLLVYAMMNLPLVVWLLYSSFKEIPSAILQAARVDGASVRQELQFILLPLALPGIVSAGLLAVIFAWNEAFFAINLTTADEAPLSVFIASFRAAEGYFWARMSAASTIAVLPIMVFGWLAQRQLVKGLTFGAVD